MKLWGTALVSLTCDYICEVATCFNNLKSFVSIFTASIAEKKEQIVKSKCKDSPPQNKQKNQIYHDSKVNDINEI